MSKIRIAVDAMGGDRAPYEIVLGALEGAREHDIDLILVGPQASVESEVAKLDTSSLDLQIVNAPETIEMGEHPMAAVRQKKDSSIVVGTRLVKDGRADAFLSAGNSGAMMAAAFLLLGRITGVERPAIGTVFPTRDGKVFLIDVGANVECRPQHLRDFALMANIYVQQVLGVPVPRVALLSTGEEDEKGTPTIQEAHALLRGAEHLNFVGNCDAKDIPLGFADIVVSDGFAGNIVLKMGEGTAEVVLQLLKREMLHNTMTKMAAMLLKPGLKRMLRRLDYEEYGGAPLLGVNGVSIISHGRSGQKAIRNAVGVGKRAVEHNLVQLIEREMA
jgi:phosphate acyltransferase